MASETSPLLRQQVQDLENGAGPSNTNRSVRLDTLATKLIDRLQAQIDRDADGIANGTANSEPEDEKEEAYLPSLLYSRYKLAEARLREGRPLGEEAAGRQKKRMIQDKVFRILDRLVNDTGEAAEVDEADLMKQLWKQWGIDEIHTASTIDLILPPYDMSSTFTSHHLIRQVVKKTWTQAAFTLSHAEQDEISEHSVRRSLTAVVTHKRLHLLSLISYIVFYSSTLSLAISPRNVITPYQYQNPHPAAIEIIYIIWAAGFLLDAFLRRSMTRILFFIPTFATLQALTAPSLSYSCLCLSIPFLTCLLFVPSSPSPSLLSNSFLLPSISLISAIKRAGKAMRLLLGLAVLLYVVFGISMNGDIYDGGFVLPSPANLARNVTGNPGTQPRVAPYQARYLLFITIIFLLILALALGFIRAILTDSQNAIPSRRRSSRSLSPASSLEGIRPEDQYGEITRAEANLRWTTVVRDSVVLPQVMVPFNIITAPLDLIYFAVMTRAVELGRAKRIKQRMWKIRSYIGFGMVLPFCLVLHVLDRGLAVLRRPQRF